MVTEAGRADPEGGMTVSTQPVLRRMVIQVAPVGDDGVIALANDGTVWLLLAALDGEWHLMKPIPQEAV